jgi:hypothetical protein
MMTSTPGCSLSAGRALSLLGASSACGVSPVPLLPQESRTFRSIQQFVGKIYFKNNHLLEESLFQTSTLLFTYISFAINPDKGSL